MFFILNQRNENNLQYFKQYCSSWRGTNNYYDIMGDIITKDFFEIEKALFCPLLFGQKSRKKLYKILPAVYVASTTANRQPIHLIIVQSKAGLEKIGKCANIFDAPLAAMIYVGHNKVWIHPLDKSRQAI